MTATLSDNAKAALQDCFATRGKHKGKLLARCPRSDTLAAAAWQAAVLHCNPYKAGIATMLFFTDEQRAIHREVLAWFESQPRESVLLDRDRATLERLGVW